MSLRRSVPIRETQRGDSGALVGLRWRDAIRICLQIRFYLDKLLEVKHESPSRRQEVGVRHIPTTSLSLNFLNYQLLL